MEKIFTKPVAQEILMKGGSEGHADVFSYDYVDEDKRGLGNLFIVGNVQGDDGGQEDHAYITSLVASLAKREYYFNPQISPREAFSAALKKINDVVEEFFKNKDLKINIGIFAIAGENVLISKLGKFKIYLARDNKNIDILNNIELFNKEHIQEKKFSNIISGKLQVGDKVLAFYPSRMVTAREKVIKDNFVKAEAAKFVEKMNSIKEDKKDFACAAIYINMNQVKEAATEKRAKPREMKHTPVIDAGEAILAAEKSSTISRQAPESRPIKPEMTAEPKMKAPVVAAPIAKERAQIEVEPAVKEEMPRIIAKEFSLGRKRNSLSSFVKRVRISDFNPRKKLISYVSAGVALVIILIVGLAVRSAFLTSTEDKTANAVIKSAEANIKTAQSKITAKDLASAREALISSLLSLKSLGIENQKAQNTASQITGILDGIDQAVEANPSIVADVPQDSGNASLLSAGGPDLFVYLNEGDKNYLAKIASGSPKNIAEIKDMSPNSIITSDDEKYSILSDGSKAGVAISDGKVKYFDLNASAVKSMALYEDNLYLLSDKVYKIMDISMKTMGKTQEWSKEAISADANLIAVDGNIFLMDKNGLLSTYFRGSKTGDKNTGLIVNPDDALLTTKDSKNLYLVNKKLGRIYVIEKESGNLMKTLKIGNSQPIISATINSSENIFILTQDNKIWKIQ